MNRMSRGFGAAAVALFVAFGAGCNDDKSGSATATTVAPTSTALAPAKPASMGSMKFAVDKAGSKVDFLMDAPKEKIHGKAYDATTGDLQLDLDDITKSTGIVTIDIKGLEIFQTVVDDTGKAKDESKSDLQNKHARTWLEISEDTPDDVRKKNENVQFSITSVEVAGEKSPAKMTGAERKMSLKVKGDFLLHQHKAEKTIELEATFKFDGDKPSSVSVKTKAPIAVDLAEFEVKPRDAFGRFAAKTLSDLSPKVNKEAMVSLDFTAKAAATTAPAKAP